MKKVYVIGTGTNGIGSLTVDASKAIQSAGLLIGAKRMLEPYVDSGKTLVIQYQPEIIAETLKNSTESIAVVLLSGDSGFFSGAKKLLPLLCSMEVTVLPGISSVSAFCAKCGISYENMRFISLHGNTNNIAVHVRTNRYCFFLLGGEMTAAQVCHRLCEYGLSDVQVHIGINLGYEKEQILQGKAADYLTLSTDMLTVLIAENPAYLRYIPSGIPDDRFTRTAIPMTKAEVRCNAVAALQIGHDAVCWDIGCGTGSVSVEMAFRCTNGQVYAFDHNEKATALTEENAHRFSCDNISVITGKCPGILEEYPAPDAVFIGGTGGKLSEILNIIASKNPFAHIALTAVSLETLSQASVLFEQYCESFQIVQIAVTRTKQIGSHTMFDAQNPVWLLSGGLKCSAS